VSSLHVPKPGDGPGSNGLATWRARQAEEKRLKMLELEHYRAYATTEVVDGREFVLVRIPDRYHEERPNTQPVQLRSRRRQRA
jgi:hypothetical protein